MKYNYKVENIENNDKKRFFLESMKVSKIKGLTNRGWLL